MTVTVDLKTIGTFIIGLALLVLIIFLIILVANLIKTIKQTNKVLSDVDTITEIAADRTEEVNVLVKNVSESAGEIVTAIKGQQEIKKAFATIVNCVGAVKSLVNKLSKDKADEKKDK